MTKSANEARREVRLTGDLVDKLPNKETYYLAVVEQMINLAVAQRKTFVDVPGRFYSTDVCTVLVNNGYEVFYEDADHFWRISFEDAAEEK